MPDNRFHGSAIPAAALFAIVAIVAIVATPAAADDPVLPWCPDPEFDDEGFLPCPCPSCMAPCQLFGEPEGECKGPDGTVSDSTFTCCCCGGGGGTALFRPFTPYVDMYGPGASSMLVWTDIPSAESFDVVRGDLDVLRGTAGDFVEATVTCAADDNPGTSLFVDTNPAPGACLWFLVRGGTGGSYDAASGFQLAPRDIAIAASGRDCN